MRYGLATLLYSIRKQAGSLLFVAAAAFTIAFLQQIIPVALSRLVNQALLHKVVSMLSMAAVLCGLTLAAHTLEVTYRFSIQKAAVRLSAELFETGVHHLLSHPLEWFYAHHSGAIQVRLERSSRAIPDFIVSVMCECLAPLFSLAVGLVIMLHTDVRVATVALIVMPLQVILSVLLLKNQSGIRVAINRAREEQGAQVTESVLGIEQVKLFHAETHEAAQAGKVALAIARQEYHHYRTLTIFHGLKTLVERGGFLCVAIFAVAGLLSGNSKMGAGEVLMLIMIYERITEPVRSLHGLLDDNHERWMLGRDYVDMLNDSPLPVLRRVNEEIGSSAQVTTSPADVQFVDVCFRYPGSEAAVLNHVTFSVMPGEHVALIGPSGSGKSTIGRLIAGLFPATHGEVLIGGISAPEAALNRVLRAGMLSQEVYIFAGTVADNVKYGRPDAALSDVESAIDAAGLKTFVEELPSRYDTQLGQHGTGLSGGQKQRLALARVLLQSPDIIVFDEPSSSLDSENARRFFDEVLRAFKNKTIVVITHDVHDLGWADRILCISQGIVTSNSAQHGVAATDKMATG